MKNRINVAAVPFRPLRVLLPLTIWSCHAWIAPTFRLYHGLAAAASGVRGVNKPSTPRPLESLNSSGFTIIELIVVMVTIGILAATVLPRIDFGSTSSRASVDGAAYMIASDIRYAQEFAMANRVSKSIQFTTTHPTYYDFNPVNTGMDPSGRLQGATIQTTIIFTFNSLGEPTAGGGSSVTVFGVGVSRTITVTPYTGKVSIS